MTDIAARRFDLIAPLLRRYSRRFTVLDVGAGIDPYVAKRISREFDAVVIAFEKDPVNLDGVGERFIWLQHEATAEDLERLSYCEHFDVVLAFNLLHHFGDRWSQVAASLEMLGDTLIVQTPYTSDMGTCGTDVTPEIHAGMLRHGVLLGDSVNFEGHHPRPIFQIEGQWEGKLSMSNWTSPENCIDARIYSTFEERTIELRHKDAAAVPFIHGMNLRNFAELGGRWPDKQAVLRAICKFPIPEKPHGDITPHNFIFDGKDLFLVDGHEGWEFDDAKGLSETAAKMEALLL